jgi:hypothetical protein
MTAPLESSWCCDPQHHAHEKDIYYHVGSPFAFEGQDQRAESDSTLLVIFFTKIYLFVILDLKF